MPEVVELLTLPVALVVADVMVMLASAVVEFQVTLVSSATVDDDEVREPVDQDVAVDGCTPLLFEADHTELVGPKDLLVLDGAEDGLGVGIDELVLAGAEVKVRGLVDHSGVVEGCTLLTFEADDVVQVVTNDPLVLNVTGAELKLGNGKLAFDEAGMSVVELDSVQDVSCDDVGEFDMILDEVAERLLDPLEGGCPDDVDPAWLPVVEYVTHRDVVAESEYVTSVELGCVDVGSSASAVD